MDIQEYIEARNKLNLEIQAKSRELLLPLFKDLIGDESQITGVSWTQYTPGFNDGDPCVFVLGELYYYLPKAAYDRGGWHEDDLEEEPVYTLIKERLEKFKKTFRALEDVLNAAFGDPAEVRCYYEDGELVFEIDSDYDCGY